MHIYFGCQFSLLGEPRLLDEFIDARFVAASMAINVIEVSRNLVLLENKYSPTGWRS